MTAEDELRARIAELEDALFDLADLVPEWGDSPTDEAVRRAGRLLGAEGIDRIRAERAARPRSTQELPRLDVRRFGQVIQFTDVLAYPDYGHIETLGEIVSRAKEQAVWDWITEAEAAP